MGGAAAAMLRNKFTELSAYVSREISKLNNLSFYLRKLERESNLSLKPLDGK